MEWTIGISLAIVTVVLIWCFVRWTAVRRLADGLASFALIVAGAAVSGSILRVIRDDTVYMTEVHSVLLNPAFLIGGGYVLLYATARIGANAFLSNDSSR
ncbi:hypothetical protein DFQ01_102261 [Paenibacillus cellulosilyticus]|uniref:Uncharacterized protein n=1 Tax=Paenibacillus cellulosilyticus TaxID=375489 RepID=A0A2V2YYP2_9BACL|nr:hypothetical protein [Paenibacillus cellulosilyticus]PWW07368.1 hypothetical protein DFQ01_102261 [Paenibacillus cellulosilyticus]QKS44461.1 hypothetical protein HUB94_08560 [Paenibacillus cellulosilyticus]